MKNIYLIRHCEAEGQPPEAPLTEKGREQALALREFFSDKSIGRIISSPFKRAIQSIEPLAQSLQLEIETDNRLSERVLSSEILSDWLEKLSDTFDDLDLKFTGGESSREAMNRIAGVVEAVFSSETGDTVIVTHGNLLSLLLKYFDSDFGFAGWKNLSNPDVFLVKKEDHQVVFERLWK